MVDFDNNNSQQAADFRVPAPRGRRQRGREIGPHMASEVDINNPVRYMMDLEKYEAPAKQDPTPARGLRRLVQNIEHKIFSPLEDLDAPGDFAIKDCANYQLCLEGSLGMLGRAADGKVDKRTYVKRQPQSDGETLVALQLVDRCPVQSILYKGSSSHSEASAFSSELTRYQQENADQTGPFPDCA